MSACASGASALAAKPASACSVFWRLALFRKEGLWRVRLRLPTSRLPNGLLAACAQRTQRTAQLAAKAARRFLGWMDDDLIAVGGRG
jgi:hypothetical protein